MLTTGLNHYFLGPYLQGRSVTIWKVPIRVHMASKTSYKIKFLLSFNTYFGSLQACLQYKVISEKELLTPFFFELVLECLQAQGGVVCYTAVFSVVTQRSSPLKTAV